MFDLTTIQLRNEQAVSNHARIDLDLKLETTLQETIDRIQYFADLLPSNQAESSFINQLNIHSRACALERFSAG